MISQEIMYFLLKKFYERPSSYFNPSNSWEMKNSHDEIMILPTFSIKCNERAFSFEMHVSFAL